MAVIGWTPAYQWGDSGLTSRTGVLQPMQAAVIASGHFVFHNKGLHESEKVTDVIGFE